MKQMTADMLEYVERIFDEDVDFINIRKRVQKAVDNSPTSVTFESALKQVNDFYDP